MVASSESRSWMFWNMRALLITPLTWLAVVVSSVTSARVARQGSMESTKITPRHRSSSMIGAASSDRNFSIPDSGTYANRGSE